VISFGQAKYSLSALRAKWSPMSPTPFRLRLIPALLTRTRSEYMCLARLPRDTEDVEAEQALFFWSRGFGECALIQQDFGAPARK
jgi:hypothetical protein